MNRKQQERANEKHNKGIAKALRIKHNMHEWEEILDEALHHILKNNKEVV